MSADCSLAPGYILKGASHTYRIERMLGSGGFGITYLASVVLNGPGNKIAPVKVAVKEFFMSDINWRQGTRVTAGSNDDVFGKYLDKFVREAEKMSRMDCPGIVKVLECFRANATSYYVMQYMPGGSLNDLIARNIRLTEKVATGIAIQICKALDYMHSHNMLHLDMKPANVMLDGKGNVVLIDFGLSKQYNEKGEPESSTRIGAGTPGYAPIEQADFKSLKDFPATMDIYALGATILKMLTGCPPPDASSILNIGFPRHELEATGVSAPFIDLVEQMMAPIKKLRPQTVGEVLYRLERINGSATDCIPIEPEVIEPQRYIAEETKAESEVELWVEPACPPAANKSHQVRFDSSIDRVEIKYIENPDSSSDLVWLTLDVTPSQISITIARVDEAYPERNTYFYTPQQFGEIIKKLSSMRLVSEPMDRFIPDDYGIGIRTYSQKRIVDDAATDSRPTSGMLTGDVERLTGFLFNKAGMGIFLTLSKTPGFIGRCVRLLMQPKRLLVYLLIIFIASGVMYWLKPGYSIGSTHPTLVNFIAMVAASAASCAILSAALKRWCRKE